ncbi:uncharacterized protein LOC143029848 isoform X2 [Oratosquilla oratoria]|uniref:uncharacterized protein LOC143029848 isoform X2 n=1 Tax=Oratosquilla oratoria TaxID=337810 RepID=UPI003F770223
MMTWNVMLGVSFWVMGLMPEVGPTYSAPRFTPAVPGKTPDCVRDPRDTFCIRSDNYPKERILYLLENKMYDIDSLLADESRNTYTFEGRDAPAQPTMTYDYRPPPSSYLPPRHNSSTRYTSPSNTYGPPPPPPPPPPQHSNAYGPPPRPPSNSYGPPTSSYGTNPPPQTSSRYPGSYDRPDPDGEGGGPYPRYPKQSSRRPYLHSGLSPPPPPRAPPKPQPWWKRFVRSSRQRRQSAEMDLCPVRADYITPQAARNNQGDWKFLVNLNEVNPQYTQLVRSEKCISNRCTGVCNVPEGFIAVCQQQYVQKRLISLDSSGERLSTDAFLFPSCCVCKVKPAE